MRIATVSDLHIGKTDWQDFGIHKIMEINRLEADILYFGGDLAEPDRTDAQNGRDNFKKGLELLAKSSIKTKLFTLGNNDLEQLRDSRLIDHYTEMRELTQEYGFHLLDASPKIVGNIGFVGNVGWYDGSLWSKYHGKTRYPNTIEEIQKETEHYFLENEFKDRLPDNLASLGFYNHCRQRLTDQLDEIDADNNIKAIIRGIHFVPNKSFTKRDNPEYAFLNWCMGAKGLADHYQKEKVILEFTGHTHRSEIRTIEKQKIYNLSGPNQPQVFDIQRDENEIYIYPKKYHLNQHD